MSRTILSEVDGFTPVIDSVMRDTSPITALVFGRMWRYCQMPEGVCRASIETIGDGVGLSRQAVINHIQVLEENGYIEDTTPELRNRPHIYKDTGKAGLKLSLSAVNDVDGAVNDVDGAVNDVDPRCKRRGLEERINKGVKKPLNPLSEKDLEQVNAQVDAIIEQSKNTKWAGREKMPEPLRELLDVFVDCTGIKPTKRDLSLWMQEAYEWLEAGIIASDVKSATEHARRPNGFLVSSPTSITKTAKAMGADRRKLKATSVNTLADSKEIIDKKWSGDFVPPPKDVVDKIKSLTATMSKKDT